MKKAAFAIMLLCTSMAWSHCQMPCGIYHDEMVFDQIDQYVETMVKCITVVKDNKGETPQARNEVIRWVMMKEKMSDDTADLITAYFLQQKIKPGEPDTVKMVTSAHKLLFLLVQIKQQVNLDVVKEFFDEWEKFKLFFHIEGYECIIERKEIKTLEEKQKAASTKSEAPPSGGAQNRLPAPSK